jgi:protein-S-isoprenylcysteine O-methyltransferase Ste14
LRSRKSLEIQKGGIILKKQANLYIIRVMLQRIFGIVLFLLGSRLMMNVRSMVYFAMYFVFAVVSMALVRSANPETLAARGTIASNTPLWDKIVLAVYWAMAYFVIYYVAGLEMAIQPAAIGWVFGVGVALQVGAFLLSLWAVRTNPFLESVSRIQSERCQTVCCCGPYATIRHPLYAAVLIWCVGISMMFETKFTAILAGMIAIIILIRTVLEDRMLTKELKGYSDYAVSVRYRLIPFIW